MTVLGDHLAEGLLEGLIERVHVGLGPSAALGLLPEGGTLLGGKHGADVGALLHAHRRIDVGAVEAQPARLEGAVEDMDGA